MASVLGIKIFDFIKHRICFIKTAQNRMISKGLIFGESHNQLNSIEQLSEYKEKLCTEIKQYKTSNLHDFLLFFKKSFFLPWFLSLKTNFPDFP